MPDGLDFPWMRRAALFFNRAAGSLLEDRRFYRDLFRLAIPMAAQNLLTYSLSLTATVMIGQLGETEIAAVALGSQIFFVLLLFLYGICTGTAVFTAQYWGVKDFAGIRRALGLCTIIAASGAGLMTAVCSLQPGWVLSLFSRDAQVVRLGAAYLRIVSFSFICSAISLPIFFVLKSIERPKLPLLITFISLILNTVLNYVLIFGKLGIPAMGVVGAAVATAVSRAVELAITVSVIYRRKSPLAGSLKEFTDISFSFFRRYLRITVPVVINEVGWVLGFTMYKVVYARMGTDVIASINISENVINLLMVAFHGTSNACAVMIGRLLGAAQDRKAYGYAVRFSIIGPFLGVLIGLILLSLSGRIPLLFKVDPAVREMTRRVLIIHALIIPFDVFSWQMIVGILRAGGDTRFSMMMEVGTVWGYGVPLAIVTGLVLHQPITLIVFLVRSEEIVKSLIGFLRLRSKKWVRKVTE